MAVESCQALNGIPRALQEDPSCSSEQKQVAPDTDKQVCLDDGKQIFWNDVGLEAQNTDNNHSPQNTDSNRSPAIRHLAKKRVVLWAILALIIILAIILGPVLGLRHDGSEKEPLANSPTSPLTSLPTTITTLPNKAFERKVAALSFASDDNPSQSVNLTHVYFQDNLGRLLEASNSADNASWVVSKTPVTAKTGSAIAAAVSRPGFPRVS